MKHIIKYELKINVHFVFITDETAVLTTDDFLPLLILLIVKSEIPNW